MSEIGASGMSNTNLEDKGAFPARIWDMWHHIFCFGGENKTVLRLDQEDLFFKTPKTDSDAGALLKLRMERNIDTNEELAMLIPCIKKHIIEEGSNISNFMLFPTNESCERAKIHMVSVMGAPYAVVKKTRDVVFHEYGPSTARISFDTVEGLDKRFIKIEIVGRENETDEQKTDREAHCEFLATCFDMRNYRCWF